MKILHSARLLVAASATLALALAASGSPAASAPAPQQSSTAAPSASSNSSASTGKKKSTHRRHSSKRQPFQKAPTPQRISEIQSALARGGYYQGEPNGKWDSNTVAALQKFQSDNGMNASGKLDAPSLQKLGLGSSTAGVDAPKPVTHRSPAAATTSSASSSNSSSASNVSPSGAAPSASSTSATAKPPQR